MLHKQIEKRYFQSINMCLYLFIGNTETDRQHITSPLSDNVYFAGEHTDMMYTGTIQGAYYSGQNTARQIMKDREDTTTKPTSDSPCGPTYSAHHMWACLFVVLQLVTV